MDVSGTESLRFSYLFLCIFSSRRPESDPNIYRCSEVVGFLPPLLLFRSPFLVFGHGRFLEFVGLCLTAMLFFVFDFGQCLDRGSWV